MLRIFGNISKGIYLTRHGPQNWLPLHFMDEVHLVQSTSLILCILLELYSILLSYVFIVICVCERKLIYNRAIKIYLTTKHLVWLRITYQKLWNEYLISSIIICSSLLLMFCSPKCAVNCAELSDACRLWAEIHGTNEGTAVSYCAIFVEQSWVFVK